MTIWKYELQTADRQVIEMPEGAQILALQIQLTTPCIWAFVDPESKKEKRTFEIYGTGHPIDERKAEGLAYVGTYQEHGGLLVFHVFEVAGI